MSTLEIILSRAMSEPEFAKQLFADADQALLGYDLTAEEIETIKGISYAEFDAMVTDPENRKSFSFAGQTVRLRFASVNN